MPEVTAELPPGFQLGRYAIEAPISQGAMGAVYRAVNRVNDQPVAVKRLLDTRHAARFEIEARLLSQLKHPRVVEVLDHFQDQEGVYYLVMELIQGTDLGMMIEQRGNPGLPVDEAVEYTRQACEALQYVHDQKIVHRDVKPQNIIRGDDGIVLVDFGVARELGASDSGTVGVGTPRYMAPEVFAGGAVSARADVFGLAATMWTLITGSPPVYADPTRLSEEFPGVTPELEQTLRAGLEIIPERRVASVSAFAQALGKKLATIEGASLAMSLGKSGGPRNLTEAVVRAGAGVFEAAAASIALTDRTTGELVYQAAWGAGANEIVGVRLPPGVGIAGSVVAGGEGIAVPECRKDPRFAAQIAAGTGYVPNTMVVVPLKGIDGGVVGVLSILDRRDGGAYDQRDVMRAESFAELAIVALEVDPSALNELAL
jgi:putative methionine-R-sulfoxide reductase with GAF domain